MSDYKNPSAVRLEIDFLQEKIIHHFDGFEELIKELVKEQLSAKNIAIIIDDKIKNELRWKVANMLEAKVSEMIKKHKELDTHIQELVDEAIKQVFTKKK